MLDRACPPRVRFVAAKSKRCSRRVASVWWFSVLWVQGADLAFGLARSVSHAHQCGMRAITVRMLWCVSGVGGRSGSCAMV